VKTLVKDRFLETLILSNMIFENKNKHESVEN